VNTPTKKQDSLSGRCFACVNMRNYPDVASTCSVSLRHNLFLQWLISTRKSRKLYLLQPFDGRHHGGEQRHPVHPQPRAVPPLTVHA